MMGKKTLTYRKTLRDKGYQSSNQLFSDGWDTNELPDEVVELHESGIEDTDWEYPNQHLQGGGFLHQTQEEEPELVFDSEQVITHLLRKKKYASILELTSGKARGEKTAAIQKQFTQAYAYDVSRNPAIAFYPKLVKRFGSSFRVEGTHLALDDFTVDDVEFLKEFSSKYVPGLERDSLIQALSKETSSMLSRYHALRKEAQYKSNGHLVTSRVSEVGIETEGELSIERVALQEEVDVDFGFLSGNRKSMLDVDDSLGLEQIIKTDNMEIHVTDLNDKDVAKQLFDDGKSEESAKEWLGQQGFSESRASNILLVLRYLKADSGKKSSLLDYSLDLGGDCEFTYRN